MTRFRITIRQRLNDGTNESLWDSRWSEADLMKTIDAYNRAVEHHGEDNVRLEMDSTKVLIGPKE